MPAGLHAATDRLSGFGGVALPFFFYFNRWLLDLSILVLTCALHGWGLNIFVGLAGLLGLRCSPFYGAGAFSGVLLARNFAIASRGLFGSRVSLLSPCCFGQGYEQ
jgi:ABC-type branched-subunit amino acid transport system permease subunit